MKQSLLRLLCAGLLMALALAASMGMLSAATDPDSPAPEPEAPRVNHSEHTQALWMRMVIVSQDQEIRLCRPDGSLLQTLYSNEEGQSATDLLEPGEYLAVSQQSRVAFLLEENASISVLRGNGWSDGEVLYLSGADNASLTLRRKIDAAELSESTLWIEYVLEGAGIRRHQILCCTEEGDYTLLFLGLPSGTYSLYENGIARARIVLHGNDAQQTLELSAHATLLTTPQT